MLKVTIGLISELFGEMRCKNTKAWDRIENKCNNHTDNDGGSISPQFSSFATESETTNLSLLSRSIDSTTSDEVFETCHMQGRYLEYDAIGTDWSGNIEWSVKMKGSDPFKLFAVDYVNKYLVTDITYEKEIFEWGIARTSKEISAVPFCLRNKLGVKSLHLGQLLRLLYIRQIEKWIDIKRTMLPSYTMEAEKNYILEALVNKSFEDSSAWSQFLRLLLELSFVSKLPVSSASFNESTFEEQIKRLEREQLVSDSFVEDLSQLKLIFNLAGNSFSKDLKSNDMNCSNSDDSTNIIFDPMLKWRISSALFSYYRGKASQVPSFSKSEIEQNINLSHPIISDLKDLRTPKRKQRFPGELNSSLLYGIERNHYRDVNSSNFRRSSRGCYSNKTQRTPIHDISHVQGRFRRHFNSTATFHVGHSPEIYNVGYYRAWIFEQVHIKRTKTNMYVQELNRCEERSKREGWPCIIYDLQILNLPFKVNERDFIQTWLLGEDNGIPRGHMKLPGLEEQYTAMVINGHSQSEYITTQILKKKLSEEKSEIQYEGTLRFSK